MSKSLKTTPLASAPQFILQTQSYQYAQNNGEGICLLIRLCNFNSLKILTTWIINIMK